MLLSDGALEGVRCLSKEAARVLRSNQLPAGVNVNLFSTKQGWGFGVDVSVVLDPAAYGTSQPQGSFGWGGGFGTWFWVDPSNEIICIGLLQSANGWAPGPDHPDCREIAAQHVYAALI